MAAREGLTPTAGAKVTAWVNGHLCGQGETMGVGGQVVYSINVLADGPGGAAGCGQRGRAVTFRVGSQLMGPTAAWNDSRLWDLPLSPDEERHIYLPLVLKNH